MTPFNISQFRPRIYCPRFSPALLANFLPIHFSILIVATGVIASAISPLSSHIVYQYILFYILLLYILLFIYVINMFYKYLVRIYYSFIIISPEIIIIYSLYFMPICVPPYLVYKRFLGQTNPHSAHDSACQYIELQQQTQLLSLTFSFLLFLLFFFWIFLLFAFCFSLLFVQSHHFLIRSTRSNLSPD